MVVVHVDTPLLPAIAAASAHGLVDLRRPLVQWTPYAVVLLPLPTEAVSALFLASSHRHFARDVGHTRSLGLHLLLGFLAVVHLPAAWGVFALFYCCVHAPRRLLAARLTRAQWVAVGACAAACAAAVWGTRTADVTDWMQMGVVAHVFVDEVSDGCAAKG